MNEEHIGEYGMNDDLIFLYVSYFFNGNYDDKAYEWVKAMKM